MAILALIVLSAQQVMGPRPQAITPIASREQSGGLTDAQLLAMFPKTPIGLITLENGKKRLIFPRHSDAERYLARY